MIVPLKYNIDLAYGIATQADYLYTTEYNMVICDLLSEDSVLLSKNAAYQLGEQPFDIPE